MLNKNSIVVIIPAYNEEESIPFVIKDIPPLVDLIIVVNNNSTDNTNLAAEKAGATVLEENEKTARSIQLPDSYGLGYVCILEKGRKGFWSAYISGDRRGTFIMKRKNILKLAIDLGLNLND